MSYIKYLKDKEAFKCAEKQHNIMVLIGNGFDIQLLNDFGSRANTTYESFYYYLKFKRFNPENNLFKLMQSEREKGNKNWSNFEEALIELVKKQDVLLLENGALSDLEKDLFEIQDSFSSFLNEIVNPELLQRISKSSVETKNEPTGRAFATLSLFLKDLSEESYFNIEFPSLLSHYHILNFLFVNFNYTSLFDNYIYLDRNQFDPRRKTIDTNFYFHPNPNNYAHKKQVGNANTRWSSYIMTNIVHPHGFQDIPRSMLFGFNDKEQVRKGEWIPKQGAIKSFLKPYWAQNDRKYKGYFSETRLFIAFGLSFGKTDLWWHRQILQALKDKEAELILYKFYPCEREYEDVEIIKRNFIASSGLTLSQEEIDRIINRIFIVPFTSDSDRVAFKTK